MPQSHDDGRSRRALLATLGLAAAAPMLAAATGAAEAAEDTAPVSTALEALRVAIVNGDAKALDGLVHPMASYGHSSGRKIQNKSEFIAELAGKLNYKSLAYSEQWVQVVGANALVRHVWDGADILPNGEIGRSYIAVLQVWVREGDRWQLLARQSCPLKAA